jgi:hypothetical protein
LDESPGRGTQENIVFRDWMTDNTGDDSNRPWIFDRSTLRSVEFLTTEHADGTAGAKLYP